MKVIIGLGNPGREYENTRHNCGFMVLDRLARKHAVSVLDLKFKSLCGKGMIGTEKVILVKPQTYMNNSGEAVRAVMDFYKLEPENIIIVYDDVDLDPGQLRIREKGTAGSHNGMKSVISHMGTTAFPRVRVGVGAKPEGWDLADYVLSRLGDEKTDKVYEGIEKAVSAVEMLVVSSASEAMSFYNRKEAGDKEPEDK